MKLKNFKNISSKKNVNKVAGIFKDTTKKRIFTLTIVTFCLIFSVVFLYEPLRNFYLSVRENDKLNAQYEALKKTNESLSNEVEQLHNNDYVKQRARDTLGLVEQGESTGYVAGTETQDARDNSANSTSSKLAYKNIKTPKAWYSPILDFIFNVHE